jgi:hypothetical protein
MVKKLAAISPFLPLIFYVGIGIAALAGLYYAGTKFFKQFGPGAIDPGGGAPSTGVLDGILNQTAEIGKSSLNYTGALQQTVTDPIGVVESILGIKQSAPVQSSTLPDLLPDTNTYPDYSGVTP